MITTIRELPAELIAALKDKRIWQPDCPVAIDRLALVTVKYIDFEGNQHDDGELIVFDAIAPRVHQVFEELLELKFPIEKIKSLHHYDGNDDRSMDDNNSSSFNFRPIAGSKTVSMHGYGLAIDINPLQNPFVSFNENDGTAKIQPPAGWQFLNRRNQKPGMVESVVSIFAKSGFTIWGGSWTTPIDYHHFQPPRMVADLLAALTSEDGIRFFEWCADHHHDLAEKLVSLDQINLLSSYRTDSESFFDKIKNC